MANTSALNIYAAGTSKDDLIDIKGAVIESVAKAAISTKIKNKYGVGDPAAGSVTYDRFKNSASKAYGTARQAGNGDPIRNTGKVTNNINDPQEIVEEFENTDVAAFGVVDLVERRQDDEAASMAAYLDDKFFEVAESAATAITVPAGTTAIEDILELAIQTAESIKNDWVRGVKRNQLVIAASPAIFGKLANHLNVIKNAVTGEEEAVFNGGVRVYNNINQTADIVIMHEGAIAQDVTVRDYTDPTRIPFSDAMEVSLFYKQGTKAVEPDLIFKISL
jgi:ketosteroid isomerase-like protein